MNRLNPPTRGAKGTPKGCMTELVELRERNFTVKKRAEHQHPQDRGHERVQSDESRR
jgi:hypothetical protein